MVQRWNKNRTEINQSGRRSITLFSHTKEDENNVDAKSSFRIFLVIFVIRSTVKTHVKKNNQRSHLLLFKKHKSQLTKRFVQILIQTQSTTVLPVLLRYAYENVSFSVIVYHHSIQ